MSSMIVSSGSVIRPPQRGRGKVPQPHGTVTAGGRPHSSGSSRSSRASAAAATTEPDRARAASNSSASARLSAVGVTFSIGAARSASRTTCDLVVPTAAALAPSAANSSASSFTVTRCGRGFGGISPGSVRPHPETPGRNSSRGRRASVPPDRPRGFTPSPRGATIGSCVRGRSAVSTAASSPPHPADEVSVPSIGVFVVGRGSGCAGRRSTVPGVPARGAAGAECLWRRTTCDRCMGRAGGATARGAGCPLPRLPPAALGAAGARKGSPAGRPLRSRVVRYSPCAFGRLSRTIGNVSTHVIDVIACGP
jgi:hypothetical protein